MRMSLRTSISPLLFSLLLAAGACGDSSDPVTIDEPDTQDAADTADTTDTADASEPTDDTESSDNTDQAGAGSAADDPAEEDDARPADESTEDDGGEAMSADPDLEAGISAWVLESGTYTSDPADGDCVAEGVISGIGTDRLAEAGVTAATPELLGADLTDEEAEIFIDSLFECVDMRRSFIDNIVGPDLNEDQANCVVDEMGIDLIRTMTKTGLLAPDELDFDELFEVINAAGDSCGVEMDE